MPRVRSGGRGLGGPRRLGGSGRNQGSPSKIHERLKGLQEDAQERLKGISGGSRGQPSERMSCRTQEGPEQGRMARE